ncbi:MULTISPECIES: MFS transporter [unclassified Methylobacterium]|jgi:MFS family permease|uniref:MFS transporter n=1 Tax=unclassified Methylobacterium TaxID=2615210 RepID=UPI0013553A27|nr:MFS transporter [Methylobacterium sp. 2A]MWV22404.1 MFS transporter [Methylobacterium sp. 2A]
MVAHPIGPSGRAAARLSLAAASVGFGQSAVLALVPVTAARTGLDPAAIGGVALLGSVVFLLCAPAWGHRGGAWRLRGLFGRLAALMGLGHALFGLALVLPGLPAAGALGLLAASRIAYGAGAAGVMPHAQAALVRGLPQALRPAALGRLSAGLAVGRILGSLVMAGGLFGAVAPLLALAASPLLLLAAPDLAGGARPARGSAGRDFLRAAAPLLAIGFALTVGLGQIQLVLGLFLQQRFGLVAEAAAGFAGATFALVAVATILTQLLVVPRLGQDLGRNLGLGLAGFAAGSGLIALAPTPWLAGLGAVLAGACLALATPTYTAALVARVPEEAQAAAAGWLASVHVLGQGIGALSGGAAFRIAPTLPPWFCAALGLALIPVALRLGRGADHQDGPRPVPSSRTVATVAIPESSVASPNRAP